MQISQLIPLCRLTIDTKLGEISLSSDTINITQKGIKFNQIFSKYSEIKINQKNEATMIKSSGESHSELTTLMINVYNFLYPKFENNEVTDAQLSAILKNIKSIIEKGE